MSEPHTRKILVGFADTHAGFKLGLLNPAVTLYEPTPDGDAVPYHPQPTEWNRYEWDCYKECWLKVVKLAEGDEIIALHVGDLTQGQKYVAHWVSTRLDDQLAIAGANLEPLLSIPNLTKLRITTGTGSHEFGEGSAAHNIARYLSAGHKDKDIQSLDHGLATVSEIPIDYAHHGPGPGIRVWLRGNNARYYLQNAMLQEILDGKAPPKLYLRGHVHEYINEVVTLNGYESRIVVLPSFCGLGDHARQVTRSIYKITNGLVAFEIIDGRLSEPIPFLFKKDTRRKEIL